MKVTNLIWMEIIHRKLSFALALAAVVVAVGYSVSSIIGVRGHQLKTEAHVAKLNDEIRKITKEMGFNVDIMPIGVNLADLYATDFGEATMPYDLVQKLADSRDVMTVNHLRPSLIRKVKWTEHDRDVILMGVAAVVPWTHRKSPKTPLEPAVAKGKMLLGAVLAEQLELKPGAQTQFRGETFTVATVHPARGSSDDITVWIDLPKAQEMLELPDRINMIQALECNCASVDRLGEIRKEVAAVLGGEVQVIERASIAIARAEARERVKAKGVVSLRDQARHSTRQTVMLSVAACAIIGLFMFINARDRRQEIGILRTIGTSTRQIVALFVGKAVALGLLGAVLGCAVGFGLALRSVADAGVGAGALVMPTLFAAVIVATIALSVLASWIPAMIAAGQDPATVLSND